MPGSTLRLSNRTKATTSPVKNVLPPEVSKENALRQARMTLEHTETPKVTNVYTFTHACGPLEEVAYTKPLSGSLGISCLAMDLFMDLVASFPLVEVEIIKSKVFLPNVA